MLFYMFSCFVLQQPQTDQFNEPLKAMEVCTVCGALLVVGDAQQRVEEHIMGKQHSGYARIRSFVEQKILVSVTHWVKSLIHDFEVDFP